MGYALIDPYYNNKAISKTPRSSFLSAPLREKFDKEKFSKMIMDMKGAHSSREFADRTGLSASFISKAASGHIAHPPSRRTLYKLSSIASEYHISLDELFEAAGYPVESNDGDNLKYSSELDLHNSAHLQSNVAVHGWLIGAKYALEKALANRVIKGPYRTWMSPESGYFSITDESSNQVYIGIPVYSSIMSTAAITATFLYDTLSEDSSLEKCVFYVLFDDKTVYNKFLMLKKNKIPMATVALFTDNHLRFKYEDLLEGSNIVPERIINELPDGEDGDSL